ncbi:MAG: hypothetical protein K1X55_06505 [Chitinophagales bacterium]|nr:hypothetical protein [Chitinophagales bacterium]
MAIIFKTIFFILILSHCQHLFSNNDKRICRATTNGNFHKLEHFIYKQIKKSNKNIRPTATYTVVYDSIINVLQHLECVDDVFWDKCQAKELLYPGKSVIGVRCKTNNGLVEKCFLIQEGTTGQINIFGWRPKVFKSKQKLKYKGTYDCNGFVEEQKKKCQIN